MAEFIGKSGSDAIYKALKHICQVINRFAPKLAIAIETARAAAVISDEQASIATTFVTTAANVCAIFALIAGNSGF